MLAKIHGPLVAELMKFGAVGGVGFLIDVSVFNLLRLTLLAPESIHTGPLIAKVISTTLAIAANWIGNRLWTYRDRRSAKVVREGFEFAMASVAGLVVPVACLWVSHYVLGHTSLLADNIASNVIGLGLGAVVRFALYRWWVFGAPRPAALA